jgi:hypothetical protein
MRPAVGAAIVGTGLGDGDHGGQPPLRQPAYHRGRARRGRARGAVGAGDDRIRGGSPEGLPPFADGMRSAQGVDAVLRSAAASAGVSGPASPSR